MILKDRTYRRFLMFWHTIPTLPHILSVEVNPEFDNNEFNVKITYKIVGADVPPQELQFVLQQTR